MASIRFLTAAVAAVASISTAFAAGTTSRAANPAGAPVIVELFTSEGCSSCPPADVLLSEFAAASPVSGARIIPLSEHVDYWDSLGWKDPFSDPQFTARQNGYAAGSDASDVYTPQTVVNGADRFVGSDRSAALAAIRRAIATPIAPVDLRWTASGELEASLRGGSAGADVWQAVTEDGLASSVSRGENAGHRLAHTAVTRRLTRLGTIKSDGSFHHLDRPALDARWNTAHLHFIVFAQLPKQGRIVAAGTVTRQ
jgi:hypothetical protein